MYVCVCVCVRQPLPPLPACSMFPFSKQGTDPEEKRGGQKDYRGRGQGAEEGEDQMWKSRQGRAATLWAIMGSELTVG